MTATMRLLLLGLLAAAIPPAAAKPVESRQAAACTVTVGSCGGAPVELDLTECACACLQNSCDVIGGCDGAGGTPFKGDDLGGAFQQCIEDSQCVPVFAPGQDLDPGAINCQR